MKTDSSFESEDRFATQLPRAKKHVLGKKPMENYLSVEEGLRGGHCLKKNRLRFQSRYRLQRAGVFIWLLTVANSVLETMLRNVYACLTGTETLSQSSQIFLVDGVFVSTGLRSTK